MVVFCCSVCCDSLKKNQVQKHYSRCRMNMVSCMDCNKEFWNDDYQEHIKCISEEEKYSGKDYKPRPGQNKGEAKQDAWLQQVDTAIKSSSASPRLRQLLERMKDYPNIPRKQAKFLNFIKNSLRISDPQLGMALWDILMSATPPKTEEEQPNGKENKDNNSDETEEKVEEEEEEPKATKNKMSKREKKEKRKEQNKTEKKDRGKKRKHNSDDDENVDDDDDDDDDEADKKRKKREENRLSKKKDKKRKREDSVNNAEQQNGQNGTKKKKSHKKQKDDDDEDDDDGLPPLEPNPNHVHEEEEEEEEEENDEDARPPKKKPNKHFNWEQIILTLLKKSKENSMSEKKLRKKVLAEYISEGYQMDSGVLKAKFDRKIKKNPRFVRHKDQIRLID